jgi:hypothetical protein
MSQVVSPFPTRVSPKHWILEHGEIVDKVGGGAIRGSAPVPERGEDPNSGNQRAYETRPNRASDPNVSALLVAGVAEVHQFPDRVILVGLNQLTTAIP